MQVLAKIHMLYSDAVSNPFYDPGMPLSLSFAFEIKKIATMVAQSAPPPQQQTAVA